MDKLLRIEIVNEVRKAMTTYSERWLTAEQICEHVGTLTPRWLKDHGQMLNRTRLEWTDTDGNRHAQAWLYPLHEIQEMILNGKIKELKS
jgi:hypothetical protein